MTDVPDTTDEILPEIYVQRRDLKHIPVRPQTQRALNDQLRDLVSVAIKLGLYDAADFILKTLNYARPDPSQRSAAP